MCKPDFCWMHHTSYALQSRRKCQIKKEAARKISNRGQDTPKYYYTAAIQIASQTRRAKTMCDQTKCDCQHASTRQRGVLVHMKWASVVIKDMSKCPATSNFTRSFTHTAEHAGKLARSKISHEDEQTRAHLLRAYQHTMRT